MAGTKGLITKRCIIPGRLDDKIAIVTGATGGIGMYTAGELARRGALVIMAGRDMQRAQAAKDKLLSLYSETNPNWMKTDIADQSVVPSLKPIKADQLILEQLDLASLESVRQFAKRISEAHPKIHYLINNAGVAMEKYTLTADGFEQDMGVNHLGHFLLTELLLPVLKAAAPSRIIILSSFVHYRGTFYKPNLLVPEDKFELWDTYNASKLANVVHAVELSKRLEGTNVTAVSLHPGMVRSDLARHVQSWKNWLVAEMMKPFSLTPWEGAQTTLYTVLADKLTPGGYYSNCALKEPSKLVNNEEDRKWLWEKSCELVGLGNQ